VRFVKNHELPYPSPQKANWACNHCGEHVDTAVLLKTAKAHVKEVYVGVTPLLKYSF